MTTTTSAIKETTKIIKDKKVERTVTILVDYRHAESVVKNILVNYKEDYDYTWRVIKRPPYLNIPVGVAVEVCTSRLNDDMDTKEALMNADVMVMCETFSGAYSAAYLFDNPKDCVEHFYKWNSLHYFPENGFHNDNYTEEEYFRVDDEYQREYGL